MSEFEVESNIDHYEPSDYSRAHCRGGRSVRLYDRPAARQARGGKTAYRLCRRQRDLRLHAAPVFPAPVPGRAAAIDRSRCAGGGFRGQRQDAAGYRQQALSEGARFSAKQGVWAGYGRHPAGHQRFQRRQLDLGRGFPSAICGADRGVPRAFSRPAYRDLHAALRLQAVQPPRVS